MIKKKMKKKLILLVTVALTSCSSAKLTSDPINDYLDNIVKGRGTKIIILDKKISNKRTLGIFKGDFMFNTKTNSYEREGKQSPLYNKEDWDEMSKKYSYDSIPEYWKKKDFKLHDIIIAKDELLVKGKLYKEYENKEFPVYSFSNPIFYHKKEYMIFAVLTSSTTFGAEPNEFVIVMKRVDNKWVIVDKVFEN